jgi:molecular chaperone DnaK
MREEAKMHEEEDKKVKERADKMNTADSLIFQTEKQLKEFGDKIPADKKEAIEKALQNLKDAHKSQDLESIDKATAELNQVWQAASEELYKASQAGSEQQPTADNSEQNGGAKKDEEVTDVDFEEVK